MPEPLRFMGIEIKCFTQDHPELVCPHCGSKQLMCAYPGEDREMWFCFDCHRTTPKG